MPYTPKDWKNKPDLTTPVTAEDLNRMEAGIDDAVDFADNHPSAIDPHGDRAYAAAVAANAQAASQPLDSDLSAIASLTTTPYGRAFLALADAATARGALSLGTAAVEDVTSFDPAGAAASAQAAAISASQPVDADLTAIAALTTTNYGRALLELADAAAGRLALALGTAAVADSDDFDAAGAATTAVEAHRTDTTDVHGIANTATLMSNPMTTQYDFIIGGASGTPTRLPKGADGTVLGVNSGIAQFIQFSASQLADWPDSPPSAGTYQLEYYDDGETAVLQWSPVTTLTVQDENSNISTDVKRIDFQGAGVTTTSGTGEVIVTIPGGGSSSGVWHTGSSMPTGGVGADGDWYMMTAAAAATSLRGSVWRKVSGSWQICGFNSGEMLDGMHGSVFTTSTGWSTLPSLTSWTAIAGGATVTASNISWAGGQSGGVRIDFTPPGRMASMLGVFTLKTMPIGGNLVFGCGNAYGIPYPAFTVTPAGSVTILNAFNTALPITAAPNDTFYITTFPGGAALVIERSFSIIWSAAVSGSFYAHGWGTYYGQMYYVKPSAALTAGSMDVFGSNCEVTL